MMLDVVRKIFISRCSDEEGVTARENLLIFD
jgi:hypothetical protein